MQKAKPKKKQAARGKGRAALSAQQSIPYIAMHPDGVCKLPGGLYTKTVEYETDLAIVTDTIKGIQKAKEAREAGE